ncbi:SDR family oxidoreductase [Sphingomonas sp.]|jgi:short-subunit dehydrogenase|uniref:SDR family oxidoreductase n=1 Tax=Sphingomonas sp. TaxID=28214 RepID=UPI002D7F6DA7|nr:SDR family oxidoreductase [Sphingomonas sp.]HEU0045850.1 SDR family oxidoreductase [Sphingomonas sp.]
MSLKLKPLAEQVIVITGASSGIGLVTARTAAGRGAAVFLIARSAETLGEVAREINNAGGRVDFAEADVGDFAAVQAAAAQAVAKFGRIDSWVNDAGSAIYGPVLDCPLDEQAQLFRTNYFGVVHGCMAAVSHLRNGGAIVTVGSLASDMPSPPLGIYSATKHAAKAYVEVLRMELAADDVPISITLVKPAGIDTPIGQHASNHGSDKEAQIPPPAYDPQLVADAILDSCEHPRREVTVGGVGRAQVLFSQHFPGLYEWLAPRVAKGAYSPNKPQPGPSNLFDAGPAGQERSGEHPARLRHSLYTSAVLHPKTTLGLGVLAAAAALLFANRGRKDD